MTLRGIFLTPVVLLAAAIQAGASAESLSVTVHWETRVGSSEDGSRAFKVIPGRIKVVDDLALGDSPEGADVVLAGEDGACPSPELEAQYETSVTIQNEGPHLDLLDWRHHTSDWLPLERVSENRFRMPFYSEAEISRFPDVTAADLRQAIAAAGGDEWVQLTRDVRSPHDPPASVGLSAIRLRVTCKRNAGPEATFTLKFPIAMGC